MIYEISPQTLSAVFSGSIEPKDEIPMDINAGRTGHRDLICVLSHGRRCLSAGQRRLCSSGGRSDKHPKNLLDTLDGADSLVTYNGSRFDIPVLNRFFGINLFKLFESHDLMYECWKCGLKGGLKSVEAKLGLKERSLERMRMIPGCYGKDFESSWIRHPSSVFSITTGRIRSIYLSSRKNCFRSALQGRDRIACRILRKDDLNGSRLRAPKPLFRTSK